MENFIMNAAYHYGDTMASINVKIPKAMEGEIARFLNSHPYYLNKSELVRDAIRHLISEKRRLSKGTLRAIKEGKEQVERGEGMTLEKVKEELDG